MISSVKAVADQVEGTLTEEISPNPQTVYGKSKQLAEQYIMSMIPPDKRVYILRPCMIHGPGNKGNLNLLYHFAKTGIPYPLAAFYNQRSFLNISNFCFVIGELLQRSDIPSGIYNVSDNEPLSTNRVMQLFGEEMHKHTRLWRVPAGLIKAIVKINDKLHLPLNSERLKKLTQSYVVSNRKLVGALNKPLPVSAEDGLRITMRSFINNH
jgi:nucleoside-diphosphate-sugar epimerase